MGQTQDVPAHPTEQPPASSTNASDDGVTGHALKRGEYYSEPFSHTTRARLKPGTLICDDSQCMLIGSYGDKYSDSIKDAVVPKMSDKPGGKFLSGVSDDLELIQDMIRNDPRKQLTYVLPDVPGAQRSASHYLAKIEKLLTECTSSGALIWYTGHGERGTGNWCFKDGFVTFEQILQLYKQHFLGKMLTLICDCCYAGQWVHRFTEILDSLKIGACGHKAMRAGYYIKVFTACHANQTAFDTYFAQHAVQVDPTQSLMTFSMAKVQVGSRSQTPNGIDSTKTGCFGEPEDPCKFDQIPPKAQWKWKNLPFGQMQNLHKRLFRIWDTREGRPYWRFCLIYEDKFDEFCQLVSRTTKFSGMINAYGWTVFSGFGDVPPDNVSRLFCHHGPCAVKLPVNRPTPFNSEIHK